MTLPLSPPLSFFQLVALSLSQTLQNMTLLYPQFLFFLLVLMLTPKDTAFLQHPVGWLMMSGLMLLNLFFQIGWTYLALFKTERRWLRWSDRPNATHPLFKPLEPLLSLPSKETPNTPLQEAMAVMPLFTGLGRFAPQGLAILGLSVWLPLLLMVLAFAVLMQTHPIHLDVDALTPIAKQLLASTDDLPRYLALSEQFQALLLKAAPLASWGVWAITFLVLSFLLLKLGIFMTLWLPLAMVGQCSVMVSLKALLVLFYRHPILSTTVAGIMYSAAQAYSTLGFLPLGWVGMLLNLALSLCLVFAVLLQFNFLLQYSGIYNRPEPSPTDALGVHVDAVV